MICLICQQEMNYTKWLICDFCTKLLLKKKPFCSRCGLEISTPRKICVNCQVDPPFWDKICYVSDYIYPLKSLIHQFKFNHRKELATTLARLLFLSWYHIKLESGFYKPDAIFSIPVHRRRLIQRGFNQAHLLASHFSKWSHRPFYPNAIKKIKHRQDQKNLTLSARASNVEGIFQIQGSFKNQTIAIIDDIITTGSTVNEVAKLLKKQGAKEIYVLCLCRTLV